MRPARSYEEPAFGSVWSWDGGEPLLAVAPYRQSFSGGEWLFMRLRANAGDRAILFWTGPETDSRAYVLPEWACLDE